MDKKTITKEIHTLENFKSLADAYAQISSMRMKKTRKKVIQSREFLEDIQEIFKELQASYREQFLSLAKNKGIRKGQKITFLGHNGKGVAVFISANTAFYGDITKKVFDTFVKEVKEKNLEATIVGNLGVSMFRESFPDKSYSYFELPDYGFDREKMAELIRHLVQYEEIHIYYGQFKSLVSQIPAILKIAAETPVEEKERQIKIIKYLFEPSLEEILMYFETERFSSLFEQTISESQLAKFSSRMIAMDRAGEKIRKSLAEIKTANLRLTHTLTNKKQLEFISSVVSVGRAY